MQIGDKPNRGKKRTIRRKTPDRGAKKELRLGVGASGLLLVGNPHASFQPENKIPVPPD